MRFVCTYIYASLFTLVAHRLTRNIRHGYLRVAFSQEIGFFDKLRGSISMQATSNGKLIQYGIIETDILKVHAEAGSYAETTLAGVRTVHAFNLRERIVSRYDSFLQDSFRMGMKKNKIYGVLFGGEYFVVHAGMGLAFWQGIAMVNRGEVPDLGTVLTSVQSLTFEQIVAI